MIKIFAWLPLHIYNVWLAVFAPNWLFKRAYAPSSDEVREQENHVRNKLRLAQYKIKKQINS